MKLKMLFPGMISRFNKIPKESVVRHVAKVKASGDYNNLETRIVWDILRVSFTSEEICDWYKQYHCNDSHITTVARQAFRQVFPDVIN